MESPKRKRPKPFRLDNSPKVLKWDIELLPNEILMNIFSHLSIKELMKCAQVSKKFRQISHDKSFWKYVNLCNQRVSCQFVAQILQLGTEYLNLYRAKILDNGDAVIPRKNNLKYLNLNNSSVEDKFLVRLLRSSVSLEKVSLGMIMKYMEQKDEVIMDYNNADVTVKLRMSWYIECLLPNAKMLTTLDLSVNTSNVVNPESMEEILLNCVELKEANFSGQISDLDFFVNNLTPKIEKLNISANHAFCYKHILPLVKRCKNITELDLGSFDSYCDFDEENEKCLIAISENLSQSLVKLQLPDDCILNHEFLKSLPKLRYLWTNNEEFTCSLLEDYPLIVLNKDNLNPSIVHCAEYFEPEQGLWEVKCTVVNFPNPRFNSENKLLQHIKFDHENQELYDIQ